MEHTEKEIFERLTAVEQSLKSLHKRQDHSDQLVESIVKMAAEIEHMRKDINDVAEKVDDLEAKPAKRWESIIAAVIGAIGGSVGTAIITKIIGG